MSFYQWLGETYTTEWDISHISTDTYVKSESNSKAVKVLNNMKYNYTEDK